MAHGGARKGAGRKKGVPDKATIQKLHVAEVWRREVEPRAVEIARADLAMALGVHVVLIQTEGGFQMATDPTQVEAALKAGSGFLVHTERPNVQSLRDVKDRLMGKPKESVEVTQPEATRVVHEVVYVARKGKEP